MSLVIWIALMVIGVIGIFICRKKQKTNPNAQVLAFVFLIIILGGVAGMLWETSEGHENDKYFANEKRFMVARSSVLADYIAKMWPGKEVVLIVNDDPKQTNVLGKAAVDAMNAGLKNKVTVSATEAVKYAGDNPTGPRAGVYNEIFDRHKSANVFVIMTQLPMMPAELGKLKCWKFDPQKTCVVLANGDVYNLKKAIQHKLIGAAAVMKSKFDAEKSAPKDPNDAFKIRYLLVTPENVNDIAAKNRDIFAK